MIKPFPENVNNVGMLTFANFFLKFYNLYRLLNCQLFSTFVHVLNKINTLLEEKTSL